MGCGMRCAGFTVITPNSKGFTLIETIVTLVVLAIAVIGVLRVFTTGTQESANPLVVDQAMQLAQGELDQAVGEKIANGFGAATLATTYTTCNSTMLSGFTCARTICYVPAGNLNDQSACATVTNYKHVTVTITYSVIGAIGNLKLETVIANY
jgi:prepilin-type N-terminal cleavage/methylation domain-containing protein